MKYKGIILANNYTAAYIYRYDFPQAYNTISIGRPDQSIINVAFAESKIQKETIKFTEIFIDEAEGQSAYLKYVNSNGEEFSDYVFEQEDISISGQVLFDFEEGILSIFNEDLANATINKEVIVQYELVEQNGYSTKMVKSMAFADPTYKPQELITLRVVDTWSFIGNGVDSKSNPCQLNIKAVYDVYKGKIVATSTGKEFIATCKRMSLFGKEFFIFDVSFQYATYYIAFEKDGVLNLYFINNSSQETIIAAFNQYKNSEDTPAFSFTRNP